MESEGGISVKKAFLLLLSFFLIIGLSGCWSAKELTDLAITTALGIDKTEEGYRLTVQVINPGEIATQTQSTRVSMSTYTTEGKTMFEAFRRLTTVSPRKVYLAHLRIVIFGEEMAREGISKPLDVLSRDHEIRTDFALGIAKGMKAEDQLKILTPLEKVSANKIFSSIEDSEANWAPTKMVKLDELISSLVSDGKEPVMTGIEAIGSPELGNSLSNVEKVKSPAMIKINRLGVFKGDKLIEWINEEESKGFNYITDNIKSTVGFVQCDEGGTVSIEILKNKTRVEGRVKEDVPKINISINIEGNIADVECPIDLSETKTIDQVEKKLSEKTNDIVIASVEKAQELKTDIFGFGEVIARQYPKEWEKLKGNWPEIFANIEVKTDTTVKIRRVGTITDSFQKEAKKDAKEE